MKFPLQSTSTVLVGLLGLCLLVGAGNLSAGNGDPESFSAIEKARIIETINPDGSVVEINELTTLVKSQMAVEPESQADLAYNSTLSTLEVLEAYTITPKGEKIPVEANAIRTVEDDNSAGAAMFSDQKHKIIIFPKVTPGSRTYYKSKLTTHTPLIPGYFYTRLTFSPEIEISSYEYQLTYPKGLKLYADIKGVQQTQDEVMGENRRLSYHFRNLKIQKKIAGQVSASDFSPYIHISTFPNQEAFARAYEDRIHEKMQVTPEVQKLANEITKGIKAPKSNAPETKEAYQQAQARALYNWVARNIRYVAIYLGDGGIIPHDVNSIIKNRYGDCKDHNALLIALLAAKGIDASSALINSGYAYVIPKYPVISPFNHVITYIPAWNVYLDSTADMASYGVLPYDLWDKPVLLTKQAKMARTPAPHIDNNRVVTGISMEILKDGKIKGKAHTKYFGSAEISARYKYEGVDTSLSEKMVKNQLAKFRQTGEGKMRSSPVYDLNESFTTDSEFTLDAITNVPGPGAMVVPIGLAPGELAIVANERPPEKFNHPYLCVSKSIGEVYQIKFPSNTKVTRIPTDVNFKNDAIEYRASYTEIDNNVFVKRTLISQRPGAVCKPEELQKWKDVYQVLIKDMRSQIFYE